VYARVHTLSAASINRAVSGAEKRVVIRSDLCPGNRSRRADAENEFAMLASLLSEVGSSASTVPENGIRSAARWCTLFPKAQCWK
jgi:hypothetical protein